MPDSDSTGAHGLRHHTQAVCSSAANDNPTCISLPPLSWDWYNVLSEILQGECEMFDQHLGEAFHGPPVSSTMRTSTTQVQNDHQARTYFGADQMNPDAQMGGLSGCQTPVNSHPRVRSSEAVDYATVLSHRTREVHACLSGPMTTTIHGWHHAPQTFQSIPDVHSHTTPPMGAHVSLSNWQTAALPPGPTTHIPDSQNSTSTSALSPQPAHPAFGDASPIVASSPVLKERIPKKILLATAICPFPHCPRKVAKFGRAQELEQHILGHLPHWICCTQPGCDWTGYRRDLLRGHLRKEHRDVPLLEHGSEGIKKIYDAKRLVKWLLKKNITVEQAVCEAHAAFGKRGV